MSTAIKKYQNTSALAIQEQEELKAGVEAASDYYSQSLAPSTKRAYITQWRAFESWCIGKNLQTLPAEIPTIAAYLSFRAKHSFTGRDGTEYAPLSLSSLKLALASINRMHVSAIDPITNQPYPPPRNHPDIKHMMLGIARTIGQEPNKKEPLPIEELENLVSTFDLDNKWDVQAKAILLLGIYTGMRRSEIVALDIDSLIWHSPNTFKVKVGRSKTNPTGEGDYRPVGAVANEVLCPIRAMKAWILAGKIEEGPLFRSRYGHRLSDRAVARLVKKAIEAIGKDPDRFAGHSLRSGFATGLRKRGKDILDIAEAGKWKHLETARGYVRVVDEESGGFSRLLAGEERDTPLMDKLK